MIGTLKCPNKGDEDQTGREESAQGDKSLIQSAGNRLRVVKCKETLLLRGGSGGFASKGRN